jgi:hypothetical protein
VDDRGKEEEGTVIVFAVFQEAVYRHDCDGIFSTLEKAIEVANACAAAGDGHHEYRVVPFELDQACPLVRDDNAAEPGHVYATHKATPRCCTKHYPEMELRRGM